ncbi:MAG: ATP-binding cassette domain-containing protein [Delftia acidovorans]|jgi:D-methionine transport system ATP-binding protein|nr:ATP-binding cassette domain-containing protein [Delftia acidovorans]
MTAQNASSAPENALIRLRELHKKFVTADGKPFEAVRSVSLDIAQGAIFGLIGKSGAGKSTLLRLINLLERPDSGEVVVAGQRLTDLGRRALREARQNIGMIFQQFNLLQNASVFENVAFPLRIHGGHSRAQIEQRVRECLDIVGLADKAGSYPAQLSGGQKQRVAIARALAPRPQVLLCDEPTSALDSETTRSILATLADINRRLGVTIVIVTHELSVVDALCTEVAIIEQGRVAEQFALQPLAAGRPYRAEQRITVLGEELEVLRVERADKVLREQGGTRPVVLRAVGGSEH